MPRGRSERTPKKRKLFLESLEENGVIGIAMRAAGLYPSVLYSWRRDDPDFARDWDSALEIAMDRLERECRRRAMEGTLKPVFHQGEECGQIREYSDTLAIFLLKGRRPEIFRDRLQSEVKAEIKGEVSLDDIGAKLLAKLNALAERQGQGDADSGSGSG